MSTSTRRLPRYPSPGLRQRAFCCNPALLAGSVRQRLWPSVCGVGEGKIIVEIKDGGGINYSFNGGRNFTSRPFNLPAGPKAMTFPGAQHGYLVGQHAMVYRYRIVPIDYTRQGMIAAMAP